jgi:hypothetical protein
VWLFLGTLTETKAKTSSYAVLIEKYTQSKNEQLKEVKDLKSEPYALFH